LQLLRLKKTKKEPPSKDTDRPAQTFQISAELREQLVKQQKTHALFGLHQNGRSVKDLTGYARSVLTNNTQTKLLLIKVPDHDVSDIKVVLTMKLLVSWTKAVYKFVKAGKELEGDYIGFIQDVQSKRIFCPSCNDVKTIVPNQLGGHLIDCVIARASGSKCAFCNNTDSNTGVGRDITFKMEHCVQNDHLNAVYQVLIYGNKGLQMADVRNVDAFICNRPMAYYYLHGENGFYTKEGFIMMLSKHYYTRGVENTPIYCALEKMKRIAKNKKKTTIAIPCINCDGVFSAFSAFYIGNLLGGEPVTCLCGEGLSYRVSISSIDTLYVQVAEALNKQDKKAASLQLEAFLGSVLDDNADVLTEFDIEELLKVNLNNQIVSNVSGTSSNTVKAGVLVNASMGNNSTQPKQAPPRPNNIKKMQSNSDEQQPAKRKVLEADVLNRNNHEMREAPPIRPALLDRNGTAIITGVSLRINHADLIEHVLFMNADRNNQIGIGKLIEQWRPTNDLIIWKDLIELRSDIIEANGGLLYAGEMTMDEYRNVFRFSTPSVKLK